MQKIDPTSNDSRRLYAGGISFDRRQHQLFYAPHGVAAGGATGIAILTQEAFGVPLGLTTLIVNVLMLVLAWVFLDRATTKRILIGSLLLPAMLAVMPQVKIVEDRLLAVIVGSVILP